MFRSAFGDFTTTIFKIFTTFQLPAPVLSKQQHSACNSGNSDQYRKKAAAQYNAQQRSDSKCYQSRSRQNVSPTHILHLRLLPLFTVYAELFSW